MIRLPFLALLALALAPATAAQYDTPLVPASGGYSDGIEDVDISGDVAVVVTRGSSAPPADSVYVFRRVGAAWLPDTVFVPPGGQLNRSVAAHGDRIVVGDTRADITGSNSGAAFVYDYQGAYPGGAWVHTGTLTGLDTDEFDQFGAAVDLTDSLAVVGAASGHPSGFDGAVYVFRRQPDSGYVQEAKLFPEQPFFDGSFGEDLAVSATASGERVLTGQPTGKPGFPETAYFYARTGPPGAPDGGWVLEDTTMGPQPDIGYGGAVALNGDLALVASGAGEFVYRREDTGWAEEALLPQAENNSVALMGSLAIIGVGASDVAGENAGALHLYAHSGSGSWSPLAVLTATEAETGDFLGDVTRVDGTQVITAGIQKVWVFDLSTLVSVEEAPAEAGPLSVYPNPTRDYATVQFSMTEPGRMQVMLHDVLGREIALVEEGTRAAGTHRVRVATASLAAGVYVVRAVMAAESGGESRTFTRRVTLLR
ncbi:MAG TPA: T9SS type A sorting domain-containing protein [Rubricoccaceae bacterium]|nr:T9SS type A sorting domain-containing protein [Rubricoccaceae bacterium]